MLGDWQPLVLGTMRSLDLPLPSGARDYPETTLTKSSWQNCNMLALHGSVRRSYRGLSIAAGAGERAGD